MSATVYTTAGGRRFHDDPGCAPLDNGRYGAGLVAGDWGGHDGGPLYPLGARTALGAALLGYTACRVCVPVADALPAAGETYGHEPVRDPIAGARGWPQFDVCARCSWGDVYYLGSPTKEPVSVAWPCTSAVVLGLVPRDGAL